MKRLRIIEHISLHGVIQVRGLGEDSEYPCGDWTAPSRTPAGREAILAAHAERFDLLLGRRTDALLIEIGATPVPVSSRLTRFTTTFRPAKHADRSTR